MSKNMHYITRLAASRLPSSTRHASHVMLYSKLDVHRSSYPQFSKQFPPQTALLVMRHDGKLGFPWLVGKGHEESYEDIMNKGLSEILHYKKGEVVITEKDYLQSDYSEGRDLCLHFYVKKIDTSTLFDIESGYSASKDKSTVLGLIHCPLYIQGDGSGGTPAFLQNNFIGNSRELLLLGIKKHKLLSRSQISEISSRSEFSEVQSMLLE